MKLTFIRLIFALFPLVCHAQDQKLLTIKDDTSKIFIESLSLEIRILGNVATTLAEMTFFNPHNEVLEGELNFPLADGQTVFRFGMDVNGKMREGVIVEKQLGRQAFEGVVRQTIDPGLLEKTVGNIYKARVYPIPAQGRKSILLAYEEELNDAMPLYQLVADYGRVKSFQIKVEVINSEVKPQVRQNDLANLNFEKWRESYLAERNEKEFDVSGTFSFALPLIQEEQVFRQETPQGDYFYIATKPDVEEARKQMPTSLAIIWDVSKSMVDRDTTREFQVLQAYLKRVSPARVRLITFSNQIHQEHDFEIREGNSEELIQILRKVDYDGGTSYQCLQLKKMPYDEILFFTDGLPNLDIPTEIVGMPPLYVLTSNKAINGDFARYLTSRTGGRFINLRKKGWESALDALTLVPYQFLGLSFDPKQIYEVYPQDPIPVEDSSLFTLAGKIKGKKAVKLTLNYGRDGKILERRQIEIPAGLDNKRIDRLWASKKVASLLENPAHDIQAITALGKSHGLITPYTSLIVLDRVEDYIRYEIEAPAELREEYNELIEQREVNREYAIKELEELIWEDYEDRVDWWKENQKDKKRELIEEEEDRENPDAHSEDPSSQNLGIQGEVDTVRSSPVDTTLPENQNADTTLSDQVIKGRVLSSAGEPIRGAAVLYEGTTSGAFTDQDGVFTIPLIDNGTLIVSFVGSKTKEISLSNFPEGESLEVILEEDSISLDEVIVTGYSTVRNREAQGAAASTIQSSEVIQGRAAGVQIQHSTGSTVVVRGSSSHAMGAEPLYLIDGKIVSQEELSSLNSGDVASVNVIKSEEATALYGNRATNGIIIIMTKEGLEDEVVLPDSIATSFDPEFSIKEWVPNAIYLDSLKNTPLDQQYDLYLDFIPEYGSSPGFYLVVGDFFMENHQEKLGMRVLSNIVELEIENHELLKILAHKYMELGQLETSVFLFQKILELRSFEPQSKRDLALAFQAQGKDQKALDLFKDILLNPVEDLEDRFPLFNSTILYEMNALISSNKDLDLKGISKEFILPMPVDIRIVLDWNTLDTDLDLWITEPNGETCYYKNDLTVLGGRLTEDYTDGYGPEEYLLKQAVPGEYIIEVDYFDERVQKISGPITLQVSIFTHYGSKRQKVRRITKQLRNVEEKIEIGRFMWE